MSKNFFFFSFIHSSQDQERIREQLRISRELTNHKAVSESEDDEDEEERGATMEQGNGATSQGPAGVDFLSLLGADQDDGADNPWLLGGSKKKNVDAQNSDGGIFLLIHSFSLYFIKIREHFVSVRIMFMFLHLYLWLGFCSEKSPDKMYLLSVFVRSNSLMAEIYILSIVHSEYLSYGISGDEARKHPVFGSSQTYIHTHTNKITRSSKASCSILSFRLCSWYLY